MPDGAHSVRNNTGACWWAFSDIYCHGEGVLVAPGEAIPVNGTFSVAADAYIDKRQAPD